MHEGLRGWYGKIGSPRWCPQQSKFGARGGKHKGLDVAVYEGTHTNSLVNDGWLVWIPDETGTKKIGNQIQIHFTHKKERYTVVYGHLKDVLGKHPRRIKSKNEKVAIAGCTGNTTYCGIPNCHGGREDHIHLVLYGPNGEPQDPNLFFKFRLRNYDDKECKWYPCRNVE